jgi:hypothetical protein
MRSEERANSPGSRPEHEEKRRFHRSRARSTPHNDGLGIMHVMRCTA